MGPKKAKKKVGTAKTNHEFKVGDIVAAKLSGFPWWPAQITEISDGNRNQVIFFGPGSIVGKKCTLKPISDLTEGEKNKKNAKLQEAFRLCQQELDKQSRVHGGATSSVDQDDDSQPSSDELQIDTKPHDKAQRQSQGRSRRQLREKAHEEPQEDLKEQSNVESQVSKLPDQPERELDGQLKEQQPEQDQPNEQSEVPMNMDGQDRPREESGDKSAQEQPEDKLIGETKDEPEREEKPRDAPDRQLRDKSKAKSKDGPEDEPKEKSKEESKKESEEKPKEGSETKLGEEPKEEPEEKPKEEPEEKPKSSEQIEEPKLSEPRTRRQTRAPRAKQSTRPDKQARATKQKQQHLQSPKQESTPLEAPSVDCSLNDLTSEQANADRGNTNTSVSEPEIIENINEEKIIAKLTKKLQTKLDEKAALKKAREEQKRYEKVSKILPKFESTFRCLLETSRRLTKNPDNLNDVKVLRNYTRCCERGLDPLEKYLIVLTNNYGMKQQELKQFHSLVQDTTLAMKVLKKKKSPHSHKICKGFLRTIRNHEKIKYFINVLNFDDAPTDKRESSPGNENPTKIKKKKKKKIVR